MDEMGGVIVLDEPIEVDTGKWIEDHIECDTIKEDVAQGLRMIVFAYANSPAANTALEKYRDENMRGRKILKGLSKYAFASIL